MSDSTLHEALQGKYPYQTEAEALFFRSPHSKPSFRLELPALGWEFSDGSEIGSEIKGVLYYNKGVFGDILPPDEETKAGFYVDHSKHTVHAKFFAPGSRHELLGEFLAKDSRNVSTASELVHKHQTGIWKKVDYVIATTTVSKAAKSTHITLTVRSLVKKAEFDCKPSDALYGAAFSTNGRLTLKDIRTLVKSNSARWYQDYIVFYDVNEFTAFFFPDQAHVTDDNVTFHNVEWTDLVIETPEGED